MARPPSWMVIVDQRYDPGRNAAIFEFRLARFWWARPSFWLDWLRLGSLR